MPFHFFGSRSTNIRFRKRFSDGQYSLVSVLFVVLLLTVPPPVPYGVGAGSLLYIFTGTVFFSLVSVEQLAAKIASVITQKLCFGGAQLNSTHTPDLNG